MKIEDIIEVRRSVELVTLAQLLQVCFCHSTCGEAEREREREKIKKIVTLIIFNTLVQYLFLPP